MLVNLGMVMFLIHGWLYKLSNNKATNLANCVGGCSDAVNVVTMWKERFEAIHNAPVDSSYQTLFLSKIAEKLNVEKFSMSTVSDVCNDLGRMKSGKCP